MNKIDSIPLNLTSLTPKYKVGGKNVEKSNDLDLKNATNQFEEFFVHYMMKEMRKSIPKDGLLSGGEGEEIFQDMLDNQHAANMTKTGGIGLSQYLYDQLKNNPEKN